MKNINCPICNKVHTNIRLPFSCSCSFFISEDSIRFIEKKKNKNLIKQEQFSLLQEQPSFLQKATNFTKSVINHVSQGMRVVSSSVKEERMSICRACPFFNQTDPKNPTCNKCGCYLEIKTGWASEKCPEGKWHDIKTASSGGCGCNKS